jgi:hypothetical protein
MLLYLPLDFKCPTFDLFHGAILRPREHNLYFCVETRNLFFKFFF